MRKQLVIGIGAVIAILAMITPAFAQGFCGIPAGCGLGGPVGCGFGAPLGGCGFGLPFGIGGCGFADPFSSIIGLGLSMIDSVLGAAFSCIGLGLGGCGVPFGIGGCGVPFGGCGVPFGGFC
jgi:hypothetical protein